MGKNTCKHFKNSDKIMLNMKKSAKIVARLHFKCFSI